MRYLLIDPAAKTVAAGDDPRLDVRGDDSRSHLAALYDLIGAYSVEWVRLPVTPEHDLIVDGDGLHRSPQQPTWALGEATFVGKALILGVRGQHHVASRLTVECVAANVTFGLPPKVARKPEIRSFDSLEEMRAYQQQRAAAGPKLFPNAKPEFVR